MTSLQLSTMLRAEIECTLHTMSPVIWPRRWPRFPTAVHMCLFIQPEQPRLFLEFFEQLLELLGLWCDLVEVLLSSSIIK